MRNKSALKYNFGSKLVKVRRGKTSQSCEVRSFPSPITSPFLGHALTFGKIFIYCNKKDKAGLKEIVLSVLYSLFFVRDRPLFKPLKMYIFKRHFYILQQCCTFLQCNSVVHYNVTVLCITMYKGVTSRCNSVVHHDVQGCYITM